MSNAQPISDIDSLRRDIAELAAQAQTPVMQPHARDLFWYPIAIGAGIVVAVASLTTLVMVAV